MTRFAFLVHPLFSYDLEKRFALAKNLSSDLIELALKFVPVFKAGEMVEITTCCGKTEGYFIVCPLTPKQLARLSARQIAKRLIQAGKYAEKLGVEILGVDPLISCREEIFNSLVEHLHIPVTSGKTYTAAAALAAIKKAAGLMGVSQNEAEILIVGAAGDFGSAIAQILAERVRYLTIIDRDEVKAERLARFLLESTGTAVRINSGLDWTLKRADIVIIADSLQTKLSAFNFKPGALVCDLGFCPNLAKQESELREDVLIIQGGAVGLPNGVDCNCALLAGSYQPSAIEVMLLALEGKTGNYFSNQEISIAQIKEMSIMGKKHGFKLEGFLSQGKVLGFEQIEHFGQILSSGRRQLTRISN